MKLSNFVRESLKSAAILLASTGFFLTSVSIKSDLSKSVSPKESFSAKVSFGGEVAEAAYGNWTYKISSISNQDRVNFCKSTFPKRNITQASSSGDTVLCYFAGYPSIFYRHQSEVCEYKHPRYGTWLGDGGASCYDSYWGWH